MNRGRRDAADVHPDLYLPGPRARAPVPRQRRLAVPHTARRLPPLAAPPPLGTAVTARWPAGLHRAAQYLPALGGQARRIPRLPLEAYTRRITGIPLTGGQAQGIVAGGGLTLTIGPQGLGTIWYPVQVTLSTTTGTFDTSTANVYLGPLTTPATLVGTLYSGNGTLALAIPPMQPGQYLVVVWTGANNGDTAAVNVIGTMDALSA